MLLRDQVCSQCKILCSVGVVDSFSNFCLGHRPLVGKMISVTGCGAHGVLFHHWFRLPWKLKLDPTFSGKIPDWPTFLKSQQFWSKNLGCFHDTFWAQKLVPCTQRLPSEQLWMEVFLSPSHWWPELVHLFWQGHHAQLPVPRELAPLPSNSTRFPLCDGKHGAA